MGMREDLRVQEIETALARFKTCPRCNAVEGFWLGLARECIFVQCKCCGSKYQLIEVYDTKEKSKNQNRLRFLRKQS
jgi:translation initiation factor 2 beta subunit (eIF-2beta)/eIF-5